MTFWGIQHMNILPSKNLITMSLVLYGIPLIQYCDCVLTTQWSSEISYNSIDSLTPYFIRTNVKIFLQLFMQQNELT